MSSAHVQSVPRSESDTLLREFTLSRTVVLQLAFVGTLGFLISLGVFVGVFEALTGSLLVNMSQFTPFGQTEGAL